MRTIDFLRTTLVKKVVQESSNIRTLVFEDEVSVGAAPGQFAMIWLPGVGELPMSLSLPYGARDCSITVKAMGEGSRALYEASRGARIGVRGPYGNSFNVSNGVKRVLLVGGGTGMAPIIAIANQISKSRKQIKAKIVIGAKSKEELPFIHTAKQLLGSSNVYPTTDDGSFGFRGLAHEQVLQLVRSDIFDVIFSCGPEKMMLELFRIAKQESIPVKFSLERIMKCGIGICGSCTVGDIVLCKDGPILDESQLARVSGEFGRYERDRTGLIVAK